MAKRCVITFCAHNDDQLIGAGGTIRKYVDQGITAYTYIFSYGEVSHPHWKPEIIAKTREKETIAAAKILGDEITFFGMKEGNFLQEVDKELLKRIIKEKKPNMIFTHSPDDPHPDHQAVHKIVCEVVREMRYPGDVYAFDIWTLFSWNTSNYPKLFVDISDTFQTKLKAFDKHESQFTTKLSLGWSIYLKALLAGWKHHCRYAELFHHLPINEKKECN